MEAYCICLLIFTSLRFLASQILFNLFASMARANTISFLSGFVFAMMGYVHDNIQVMLSVLRQIEYRFSFDHMFVLIFLPNI